MRSERYPAMSVSLEASRFVAAAPWPAPQVVPVRFCLELHFVSALHSNVAVEMCEDYPT